jgi:hypothetical protein
LNKPTKILGLEIKFLAFFDEKWSRIFEIPPAPSEIPANLPG